MVDPLGALIYDPERDGVLKSIEEITAQREARTQELLRTPGTEVRIRWRQDIPRHLGRKIGVVTGTDRHQVKDTEVIFVRLLHHRMDSWFFPGELLLRYPKQAEDSAGV